MSDAKPLVYYAVRDAKTGKYLNKDFQFSTIDAVLTQVFHSREQAQEVITDPGYGGALARVWKRCEVVTVQLLRV